MKRGTWVGSISGFIAGFVVAALLFSYPKYEVTRHRYCLVCAEYEESYREGAILGARSGDKTRFSGPIARLMIREAGEHEHRYTAWTTIFPTFGAPSEHPEIAEIVLRTRSLENDPSMISALEQAMRNDHRRTLGLMQRSIDPADRLPMTVLLPMAGEGTWEEKWAKVDAEVARQKKKN